MIKTNKEKCVNLILKPDTKFFYIGNNYSGNLEFNNREEQVQFIDFDGQVEKYYVGGTYARLQDAMCDLVDFFKRPDFEDYVEQKSTYTIWFIQVKNGKKTEKKVLNIRAKDIELYTNY